MSIFVSEAEWSVLRSAYPVHTDYRSGDNSAVSRILIGGPLEIEFRRASQKAVPA